MKRPRLLAGRPPGPMLQTVTPSSSEASLPSARPAGPCDPEASRVPQHCPSPCGSHYLFSMSVSMFLLYLFIHFGF